MSVNISVSKAIDSFLTERAKTNDRDMTYFHASGWEDCHRKIAYAYYEAKGIIQIDESALKIDPQLQRIFDNGHYMHDRWRDYVVTVAEPALLGRWQCLNWIEHKEPMIYGSDKKLGCLRPEKCQCGSTKFRYVEVGFYDENTWWGGNVDTIIDITKWPYTKLGEYKKATEVPEDERYFIIDYKTMNPFEYKDLSKPKPEHLTQMQVYLYLSGLKNGKFLYENKANQSLKEYLVRRDDAMIAVKKEEAIRLKYQITNLNSQGKHVLPPRGYDSRGHKKCLECKYRGHCWKGVK